MRAAHLAYLAQELRLNFTYYYNYSLFYQAGVLKLTRILFQPMVLLFYLM